MRGENTTMADRLWESVSRVCHSAAFRARQWLSNLNTRGRIRRAKRQRRVLVLGDSHARVFRQPIFDSLPVRFETESIMGATVTGLENPNSQTQAGPIFERRLADAATTRDRPVAVILMLGEVDCGFLIWWLHERQGVAIDTGLEHAVDNLMLLTKRALAIAPVIVVSAPLPTIRDNAAFPEYAGLRREIKASQSERTDLIVEFNRRTRAATESVGATYLDLDAKSLGPDGLVSPLLVQPFATDHHYDGVVYSRLLERTLRSLPTFRV